MVLLFNPLAPSQYRATMHRYMYIIQVILAFHILSWHVLSISWLYRSVLPKEIKIHKEGNTCNSYLILLNFVLLNSFLQKVHNENKQDFYFWPAETTSKHGQGGMRSYLQRIVWYNSWENQTFSVWPNLIASLLLKWNTCHTKSFFNLVSTVDLLNGHIFLSALKQFCH